MRYCILFFTFVLFSFNAFSQETPPKEHKWSIALPLRFTHLQNHTTMLSGFKLGRQINQRVSLALSVYHSFYVESFKAQANVPELTRQQMPRLFINGVGPELQYAFWQRGAWALQAQLLIGWGFMKYESKDKDLGFESSAYHFVAVEPSLLMAYQVTPNTQLEWGIGYRPLLGAQNMAYQLGGGEGEIAVENKLPNGLMMHINLVGFF
ncbi:hypothetical protein [Shiella aurantiaca]|nr:hypothetical protein [Shiella aurantiaca]